MLVTFFGLSRNLLKRALDDSRGGSASKKTRCKSVDVEKIDQRLTQRDSHLKNQLKCKSGIEAVLLGENAKFLLAESS